MTNKIIQGDCLEIMPQIPDGSIDMILCDLPYGTTACKWDSIIPFDELWSNYKRTIKPNGAIVLTASQPFTSVLVMSNIKMFKYCWVWEKCKAGNFVQANYQPLKVHEDICIFSFGGSSPGSKLPMLYNKQYTKGKPYDKGIGQKKPRHTSLGFKNFKNQKLLNISGNRNPRTVIYFPKEHKKQERRLHPTQKPVALFEYLIKTYTNEGDLVLDNCAGSGTTGVACQNLNRDFILIEKEEKYIKIIKERLNDTTQTKN